jgi:inner membrane protein
MKSENEETGGEKRSRKRSSLGAKLVYVVITGLVSLIPLSTVSLTLRMRDNYATRIITQLEQDFGGPQRVFGPFVMVPTRSTIERTTSEQNGQFVTIQPPETPPVYFAPDDARFEVGMTTTRREKSLYGAIAFEANVDVRADFGALMETAPPLEKAEYLWNEAQLVLFLSNTGSSKYRPELTIGAQSLPLYVGAAPLRDLFDRGGNNAYSTVIGRNIDPRQAFTAATRIAFNGAARFSVAPSGRSTELSFRSDRAPSAVQNFSADISAPGPATSGEFSENWKTAGPYRTGVFEQFFRDANSELLQKQDFSTSFDAGNIRPYQEIMRAVNYGMFLMGFAFLTFFLLEAGGRRPLHVGQYFLLGLIQTLFYALLMAVAEFTGFSRGYMICAAATVIITGLSVGATLGSFLRGIVALLVFAAFYAVQYILMDMAQYSLLVASAAAFLAVGITLVVTARADWSRVTANE